MLMKKRIVLNRKRILSIVCVLLAAFFILTPITSQAAKLKVTKAIDTRVLAQKKKYAKKVKKGETTVTMALPNNKFISALVFTVPKTKKWTFSVSGMVGKGTDNTHGWILLTNDKNKNIWMKTQGGKSAHLNFCTPNHRVEVEAFEQKYHTKIYNDPAIEPFVSRSGTVKLKKGQKVYICLDLPDVQSFNLTIK